MGSPTPQTIKSRWNGRDCYKLSNGSIRLVTLLGGGHIAEFSLTGDSSVSPLWVPPWKTKEPYSYESNEDSRTYGDLLEGKLLSGISGHNICLDYFGSPSREEVKQGLSQHGEAPSSRWILAGLWSTENQTSLTLQAQLPAARLHFERTITLRVGEPIAHFRETVTNLAPTDHFFHWTQHVTLGPPFLSAGNVAIALPGTKGVTFPHGYDEGRDLLARGVDRSRPTGLDCDLD